MQEIQVLLLGTSLNCFPVQQLDLVVIGIEANWGNIINVVGYPVCFYSCYGYWALFSLTCIFKRGKGKFLK